MKCCYRDSYKPHNDSAGKVRVRFTESTRNDPVQVDEKGFAVFHQTCWKDHVLQSSSIKSRAFSARCAEADETADFFYCASSAEEEAKFVAEALRHAKRAVVITGAGISTAVGIGDFRGIFGKWTEEEINIVNGEIDGEDNEIPYEDLRPRFAHEAVAWLVENDVVKF